MGYIVLLPISLICFLVYYRPAVVMPSEPQAPLCNNSSGSGSTTSPSTATHLPSELEQLKRELLQELRDEMKQMKLDIISGMKQAVRIRAEII